MGYDTVISVKKKILSEEAVLTSKNKNSGEKTKNAKERNDEIALQIQEAKDKTAKEIKEQVLLMFKGKSSRKGNGINKGINLADGMINTITAGMNSTTATGINHLKAKAKERVMTKETNLILKQTWTHHELLF
jgi:hypothetical protein